MCRISVQEDAQKVADQIAGGAAGAFSRRFVEMDKIRDVINETAAKLTHVASRLLPPEFAAAFAAQVANVQRQMLDALRSGKPVDEIKAELEDLSPANANLRRDRRDDGRTPRARSGA